MAVGLSRSSSCSLRTSTGSIFGLRPCRRCGPWRRRAVRGLKADCLPDAWAPDRSACGQAGLSGQQRLPGGNGQREGYCRTADRRSAGGRGLKQEALSCRPCPRNRSLASLMRPFMLATTRSPGSRGSCPISCRRAEPLRYSRPHGTLACRPQARPRSGSRCNQSVSGP